MNKFQKYIYYKTKKPLSEETQRELISQYIQTGDREIRNTILEHNQRLCVSFAIDYCVKYHCQDKIEDVYCEANIALSSALNSYKLDKGANFATYAIMCMKNHMTKIYLHDKIDAQFYAKDVVLVDSEDHPYVYRQEDFDNGNMSLTKDTEYVNDTQLDSATFDEILDGFTGNELVSNVIAFIDSFEDEQLKIIMKKYLGIGYPKTQQWKIAEELGMSQPAVGFRVEKAKNLIGEYLAKNYPLSYPQYSRFLESSKIKFNKIQDKYEYIYEKYCSGEKSSKELAYELGMTVPKIHTVIYKMNKREKEVMNECMDKNASERIFNAYFGLNGFEVQTSAEIVKNNGLSFRPISINHVISVVKKDYLERGVYTQEELDELERKRVEVLASRVEKYAYEYYSLLGAAGYEKKSAKMLSEELGVSRQTIYKHIGAYEEYLKRQNMQNKEIS